MAWSEVERDSLRPDGITIRNIWDWLRDRDDPWEQMEKSARPLPPLAESDKPDRSGRRRGVPRKERP
jgi:DNA primase